MQAVTLKSHTCRTGAAALLCILHADLPFGGNVLLSCVMVQGMLQGGHVCLGSSLLLLPLTQLILQHPAPHHQHGHLTLQPAHNTQSHDVLITASTLRCIPLGLCPGLDGWLQ